MNYIKSELWRAIVTWVLGLIVVVILLFLLRARISATSESIALNRNNLELRNAEVSSFTELDQEYENRIKNYLAVLDNLVPTKEKLLNIKKDLEVFGSAYNLDVIAVIENDQSPGADLGYLAVNLTLYGLESDIQKFITEFNKFRYLGTLHGFTITKETTGKVRAVLQVRVYYDNE